MSTTLIEVRPAKAADATAVASTHDEAWRSAYQGIIPGAELEKLINRRGPQWWDSAIRKGSRVSVLVFGDKIAGYANYGRKRARRLHFDGEIVRDGQQHRLRRLHLRVILDRVDAQISVLNDILDVFRRIQVLAQIALQSRAMTEHLIEKPFAPVVPLRHVAAFLFR